MQDSIRRYFQIAIGIIGVVISGAFIVSCFKTGAAPLVPVPGYAPYPEASQSSQFWFIVFFAGVACVGFAWLAWHAFRS
jgi:hypothetical protein